MCWSDLPFSIMARHGLGAGAFVYVADSAMVTEKNLETIGTNLFISRLPANYTECARVIAEAVDSEAWTDIGKLAENAVWPVVSFCLPTFQQQATVRWMPREYFEPTRASTVSKAILLFSKIRWW